MTPKEKAKELVDKLKKYSPTTDYDFQVRNAKDYNHNAKQCALIAVDELLQGQYISIKLHEIEFWEKVKREIKKL